MIRFSDGIRHEYLPGLNDIQYSNIKFGICQYLVNAKSYIVTQDQSATEFYIDTYSHSELLSSYAYDLNRISCAAIESLNNIYLLDSSPKFFGWNLTKLYYSAFFSAHCILRITGRGLLNIDAAAVSKVKAVSKIYSFNPGSFQSGPHSLERMAYSNSYKFSKNPKYDESHAGLWLRLLDFLQEIKAGIYHRMTLSDAQLIVDKIEELEAAMTYTAAKGGWLSKMRNSINYSQHYGVWFPYKNFLDEYSNIIDDRDLFKNDPLSIDVLTFRGKDVMYFARTCQLINSICYNMLIDINSRNSDNKSFIKNGIIQYMNKHTTAA